MEKQKLNNARVIMLGHYLAVYNIECIDKQQKIWRGEPVPDLAQRAAGEKFMFFSRKYDKENNDMDKILPELHFTDTNILGVEFYLIPKDKILFGYEPPPKMGILIPKVVPIRQPGRPN